jgi:hypothetical protein
MQGRCAWLSHACMQSMLLAHFNCAGKVFIDATNPLSAWPKLEVPWDGRSGGELLQARFAGRMGLRAFATSPLPCRGLPLGPPPGNAERPT